MKKFLLFIIFLISVINIYSIKIENNMAVDSFGNSVPLKEYNKIIAADPAAVEIFYLIGGENKISAVAKTKINKIYPEEKTKLLESVGSITRPSIEKIISLNPDLVILNPMGAVKTAELLKKYNIPYFIDRSVTFDEIFLKTKIYGIFTGQEKNAEKLIEDKNLKGVILYSSSPMISFSKETIPSEIMEILKIKNIADSFPHGKKGIISPDVMLTENPDIIIGTMKIHSAEDIVKTNEFLKYSKAYKNNNIYVFESEKILRATPRIGDGIEEIYEVVKNVEK